MMREGRKAGRAGAGGGRGREAGEGGEGKAGGRQEAAGREGARTGGPVAAAHIHTYTAVSLPPVTAILPK